ncbi:MAG: flagellar export chaperone FlgN [Candidatus Sericytochromatia bacterium]|nr:flagellar export chaperone FlgN [Candidatus Sericytochromatia bacterium]
MSASYDRLDFVLGQQVAGLTALKNWLPRKVELLNRPNPQDLEALNSREEAHVKTMRQLEAERNVLEALLKKELALEPDASFGRIVAAAPAMTRSKLEKKMAEMQSLADAIKDRNAIAQGLILRAKVVVDATLDAFAELSSAQAPSSYADEGHRHQAQTWMVNRTA